MASLELTQHFIVTIDGVTHSGGSKSTPQTLTVGSTSELVVDQTFQVASSNAAPDGSATVVEIYSNTTQATFDFLFVESTTDALMQILVNEDDAAEAAIVIELKAGIPFMLFSDTAMHGAIGNIDTWESAFALDVIDRIEYHQSSGAASKVRVFAVSD